MGLLDDILASKRAELPKLREQAWPEPPPLPEVKLRSPERLELICEIKRRSPSAGQLSTALSVSERARRYERAGASMVSVLCDGPFFDGSYRHLLEARQGCALPLLCKEFVLEEVQLEAARAYGASAILLIVRCLPAKALARLIGRATALGLVPIVEVTTEEESAIALGSGATHVGVNARDLDTLVMDHERAARVLGALPPHVVALQFSGIKDSQAISDLSRTRADGALVGEVLMRQDDPEPLVGAFAQAARRAGLAR